MKMHGNTYNIVFGNKIEVTTHGKWYKTPINVR